MFSGGLSSAITALWLKNQGLTTHWLFTDTLIEDEDLYRFVKECHEFIQPDQFHWISDGRNPWDVFFDVAFLGNSQVDPCSRVLKREIARKFVDENYKLSDICIHFGIHWSEAERLFKARRHWHPYTTKSPMVSHYFIDGSQIRSEWEKLTPIRVPRLYDLGFLHNNCGGFCVKAGKKQFELLLKNFPERYKYHEEMEHYFRVVHGNYSILREQRSKVTYKITLKDLRARIQKHIASMDDNADMHENNGCACFL